MKEARFVARNKDKWRRMEKRQSLDAEIVAENFMELSDDLAYARTFYPGSETELYLNQLIGEYQVDINARPAQKRPWFVFWRVDYPLLLAKEYRTLIFAFVFLLYLLLLVLFLLPMTILSCA